MSTQRNNVTNLSALLRAGAEFHFSNTATSVSDSQTKGFTYLGNVVDVTPAIDTQKVEHVSSNRGAPRKDREDITRSQIQFKIKVDEFLPIVQKIMLGGSTGTDFTQASKTAQNADTLAFSGTAAVIGNWYDLKISGARYRNLTACTVATKTEGTDFIVDNLTGRICFLTAQSSDLVPVISCPTISAGGAGSFVGIKPGQTVKLSGFGRLLLFDQDSSNAVFSDYNDFSCEVTLDTAAAFNATSFADLTFSVLITDTVGNWLMRYGATTAGTTT
jgi:hypothetical protein